MALNTRKAIMMEWVEKSAPLASWVISINANPSCWRLGQPFKKKKRKKKPENVDYLNRMLEIELTKLNNQ